MIVLCLSSTATCIVIVRVMNVWQNLSYFAGSNKAVTAVRLSPGGHPARKLTSASCIPLINFEDSLLVDLQYL